ncbi:MAG: hypothetical protein NTX50_09525 [Candidatus Sumerlaeota bacterium]|nr:hypothetical protein [Candidatus Sumerlaeota bacterium]
MTRIAQRHLIYAGTAIIFAALAVSMLRVSVHLKRETQIRKKVDAAMESCALALGQDLGTSSTTAADAVTSIAANADKMNALARQHLMPLGHYAIPALIKWLRDERPIIRATAAHALYLITNTDPGFDCLRLPRPDDMAYNEWFWKSVKPWRRWYAKRLIS